MHYEAERPDGTTARFETYNGNVIKASDGMHRLLMKGIDSALQMLAEQHCIVRVSEYPAAPSAIVPAKIHPAERIHRKDSK